MHDTVTTHLACVDPKLGHVIAQAGPCRLKPSPRRTPFQALVRAVAYQQLNDKAASTILGRFLALFPKRRFPSPEAVAALELSALKAIGFSRAKAGYVQEIAHQTLAGLVPTPRQIAGMTDDAIVERLTQIKGVGRWTVEMYLMFGLGRPDVLPAHDYGIQQGFALVYGKRRLPDPKRLLAHGERWRPYRSTAAWYLWRALDLHRKPKP